MIPSTVIPNTRHPNILKLRKSAMVSGFVAFLLLGDSAAALAQPVKVSADPSVFATCIADDVANQPGTNYPGSEIEPYIAADPAHSQKAVAGWQQDRWSNGGSRGLLSAFSTNGGATWTQVTVPGVSACSGGSYLRASDPWVSTAPNGPTYFFSLAFDPNLPNGAFGPNAMLVSRSLNGGQSWGAPIPLVQQGAGQILHDKNSLTADYTNSNFAYAVWDRLRDFTLPTSASAPAKPLSKRAIHAKTSAGDGVGAARQRRKQLLEFNSGGNASLPGFPTFFAGPAMFSRTRDGGTTWEPPKPIFDPGKNAQTINNLVEVQPDGDVYDFYTHIFFNGQAHIGFVRSTDKGVTFSGEHLAQRINSFGAVTPDTKKLIRDASILFDTAVDRTNGNLYLVWQDIRFGGKEQIAFSMSTNGGQTWSTPININKTPIVSHNPQRRQAFIPAIAVADNGRLAVTYYDFRNDISGPQELVDHWAVFCSPRGVSCVSPASWGSELRLTDQSSDIAKAPVARGLFVGDYMGLSASGNVVYPAFGIVDGQQTTSIYIRPIDLNSAVPVITAVKR